MLDPTGTITSKWEINGYGKSIDFGSLNYHSDNMTNIKLTMGVNSANLIY